MKSPILVFSLALIVMTPNLSSAAELKAVDPAEFGKLFAPQATVKTLVSDLQFTEGPVWVGGPEGFLIFSDIPANKLLKWSPQGGLSVFREPSQKANGNTLDRQGRLITCEHWGRKVSRTQPDGTLLPLVASYQGKQLNSPNDAVVKSDGTLWFTDPDYGLEGRSKEQAGNFVFRFEPASQKLSVVADDFDKPNGLCFSPDETFLYVADSGRPRSIRVFPVLDDGTLGPGKVFVKLDQGGPDGIRCDAEGRIWSSSGDGAQVFTPQGKLIARILLPKAGANLCFGGPDGRTLFITARDGLYSVETKVKGAQ